MLNTTSKLKVAGFAGMSLLMAALMTVVGHSIQGLLWERPKADAALVSARADAERARAELQKAQAELEKARAEIVKSRAAQQQAEAAIFTSFAEYKKAMAALTEARARQTEVTLMDGVGKPYIADPAARISSAVDRSVGAETALRKRGITEAQRHKLGQAREDAEAEEQLAEHVMVRKLSALGRVVKMLVGGEEESPDNRGQNSTDISWTGLPKADPATLKPAPWK